MGNTCKPMAVSFQYMTKFTTKKKKKKNPSCDVADVGLTLGWITKILHAMEQIGPRTTTREPMSCNY